MAQDSGSCEALDSLIMTAEKSALLTTSLSKSTSKPNVLEYRNVWPVVLHFDCKEGMGEVRLVLR